MFFHQYAIVENINFSDENDEKQSLRYDGWQISQKSQTWLVCIRIVRLRLTGWYIQLDY